MAKRSKLDKDLSEAFDLAFSFQSHGVQFSMMDLGKIRSDVLESVKAGTSMDEALKDVISRYRKN